MGQTRISAQHQKCAQSFRLLRNGLSSLGPHGMFEPVLMWGWGHIMCFSSLGTLWYWQLGRDGTKQNLKWMDTAKQLRGLRKSSSGPSAARWGVSLLRFHSSLGNLPPQPVRLGIAIPAFPESPPPSCEALGKDPSNLQPRFRTGR